MDVIYGENIYSLSEDDVNYLCSISGFFKNISECKDNKQVVLKNFESVFVLLKNEDLRLKRMTRKEKLSAFEFMENKGKKIFGHINNIKYTYFLIDFIEKNLCIVYDIIEGLKYFQTDELLEFFLKNYKYFMLTDFIKIKYDIVADLNTKNSYFIVPFVVDGKLLWGIYTHNDLLMLNIDINILNFFKKNMFKIKSFYFGIKPYDDVFPSVEKTVDYFVDNNIPLINI
jgi:hypothetical protein